LVDGKYVRRKALSKEWVDELREVVEKWGKPVLKKI
jgi:hypothetical protein